MLARSAWGAAIASLSLLASCGGNSANWAGTWEIRDPTTDATVKIVLSDDGKAYVESPTGAEGEVEYLELPLERISDEAALPEDAKTISLEDAANESMAAAAANEGQAMLGAMVRGQQAYHLERGQFAANLDDLMLGIEPETDNYLYEIVTADGETAHLTATAKNPDLNSMSALVYVNEDGSTTAYAVCTTNEPSTTAPGLPEVSGADTICPDGSSPL